MKKLFIGGPIFRMSVGMISLVLALVLMLDAVFGTFPSERKQQAELRRQVSLVVGSQVNAALNTNDGGQLRHTLKQLASTVPDLLSVGVRHGNRLLEASTADHAQRWADGWQGESTLTHVAVPIMHNKEKWGEIEVLFADKEDNLVTQLIHQPSIMVVLLLSTLGFAAIYFYLRRALHYLDPSQAVPQRVRKAFDTLTEAVLILDQKACIRLANDAFIRMNGGSNEHIEGLPINEVGWLIEGLTREAVPVRYPWEMVLRSGHAIQGHELTVRLPDGSTHELRMNCSAISDGAGVARGCLISFDDVTQLIEANEQLQTAMKDLEASRDQIQRQNEELQKVAHFDPLTGCLNRRAFFARAEPLFEKAVASGGDIVCVMGDIDFFKSYNDRFGHAIGDQVIQQVARALGRSLRDNDVLCRFGGEEFCILLTDLTEKDARKVAERMRAKIEKECGAGVRSIPGLKVTSSFGMAALSYDRNCSSLSFLIEHADEALYAAKKSGRNRVMNALGELIAQGEPPEQPAAHLMH